LSARGIRVSLVLAEVAETRDLAGSQSDVALRLLAEIKDWTTEVKTPIPSIPNDTFNPAGARKR